MPRTPQQQLWIALSNLYLDTDVTAFYPNINRVIAEHGFSDSEVERTLIEEVEPALYFNLIDLAGEWAGFDEDWLIERITTVKQSSKPLASAPSERRRYVRQQLKAIQAQRGGGSNA